MLNKPDGFMSEHYKYKRLKDLSQGKFCRQVYLLFKYYSQFQHISPATHELLNMDSVKLDNKFLLSTIENILISTNLILKTINKNGYKEEIGNFINILQKCKKIN